MLLELVFGAVFVCVVTGGDNFPSLLTTNATLAVIIDREYLGNEYSKIKHAIDAYLIYAKREILKHGGVNVQYYSWTGITIKKDVTAILSIASCSDTWRLFKVAEDAHLLHMAISESDCPRLPPEQAITVPLLTRGEEMPQLLLDLRTANIYNWKSAVILYDDTLSRDQVTRVVKSLTAEASNLRVNTISVSLLKLIQTKATTTTEMRASIRDVLSSIRIETVGRNFLAIVSFELVDLIMEYAKTFQLVDTRNQWLYVISTTNYKRKDIDRFKQLLTEGDNVAFLYNNTLKRDTCTGGLQCHCEEILSAFTRALDEAIVIEWDTAGQVSDEEWEAIRPSKTDRRNGLLQSIKAYLLRNGECDNCTSWLMKTGDTWGREYQPNISSSDNRAELISVGNWRPSDGPSMTDELFPHIVHGFRKRNLPVVSFHNPPWQIIKTNASGSAVEYTGLVFDIIKELSRSLNFTYTVDVIKIVKEADNSSNSIKVWTKEIATVETNFIPDGIIDVVKNKTAAFGACAFTVTENGKRFINFTKAISVQPYTFVVSRPRELSRALLFMSPFTRDTWLCLSAAIISMGPILYYINRYSPVYQYRGITRKGGLSTIQNCIWYMYGALLQQGGMHLPQADSARILVGGWWLVVLVVATTYCGNLVAFLTFPKIDIPITTIDELLSHSDTVSWSLTKDSYLEGVLKTSEDPKYRHLYEKSVDLGTYKGMIKDIVAGRHVRIDWKITLQYIMKKQYLESDRCDLVLGLDEFFNEQLAMIVAQDTPYLTIFNDEIKKLHQVGLIEKWLKDYLPKRDRCWKNRHIVEVNNHTVNMDDMQGSFFVLFLGFLIALFVTLVEKLCHKYVTKTKKKIIQPFTT